MASSEISPNASNATKNEELAEKSRQLETLGQNMAEANSIQDTVALQ
jgi:hypothetical protein